MQKPDNLTMSEIQQGCSFAPGDGLRTKFDLYYMQLYSSMDKKINSDLLTLQFHH